MVVRICGVVGADLPHRYENSDLVRFAQGWLAEADDSRSLFARVVSGSHITSRSYVCSLEEIAKLRGQKDRGQCFARCATEFALTVARAALTKAKVTPAEVGAVIFTSCTVPKIPSVDIALVTELGVPPTVMRLPFFQHGCGGGAVGLRVAGALAGTVGPVLIVSVELCSLLFQREDLTGGSLIGTALFADGASSCVVQADDRAAGASDDTEPSLVVVGSGSYVIPNSHHLMGYRLEDNGPHLFLEKELPGVLAAHAPAAVARFLTEHHLPVEDVPHWLIHPGGKSILRLLGDGLGLKDEQLQWSWEVLSSRGNMSSSSLFYVAERFLLSDVPRSGDLALFVGVGPGISLELTLVRVG